MASTHWCWASELALLGPAGAHFLGMGGSTAPAAVESQAHFVSVWQSTATEEKELKEGIAKFPLLYGKMLEVNRRVPNVHWSFARTSIKRSGEMILKREAKLVFPLLFLSYSCDVDCKRV